MLFNFREKMAQAYDFALDKMGMDIASYSLWNDYVKFLKAVDAVGSYAENQKISAIRKIYQRGIVNPMINIEQFWYVRAEVNLSSSEARKQVATIQFLSEVQSLLFAYFRSYFRFVVRCILI